MKVAEIVKAKDNGENALVTVKCPECGKRNKHGMTSASGTRGCNFGGHEYIVNLEYLENEIHKYVA